MYSKKAERLVERLIAATEEHAFLGAKHEGDRAGITKDFHEARRILLTYLDKLEGGKSRAR